MMIRKIWQYPSVMEVNIFPNTVPVISGQNVVISYPKTVLYSTWAFTELGIETEEPVNSFSYHPDQIFDKKRQQHTFPNFFFQITSFPERVQYDKFQPIYPDKVWDSKRQQYTYPSLFFQINTFPESPHRDASSFHPDKIWDLKRQQYTYPNLFLDPATEGQVMNPSIDKWLGNKPDKIWDRKRQQHTYPYFFFQITRFPETIYAAALFEPIPQPNFKKQSQYLYSNTPFVRVVSLARRVIRHLPFRRSRMGRMN